MAERLRGVGVLGSASLDLDVLFTGSDGSYQALVVGSPAGEGQAVSFSRLFSDLELENLLLKMGSFTQRTRRIETAPVTAAKLAGARLFDAVFAGSVGECMRRSLDHAQAAGAALRALGVMLHDHTSMRLAVLNACQAGRTDPRDPFAGVADTLVRRGIPAVIAMQFEITDTAAAAFAPALYGALAAGWPIDKAVAEARKAIYAVRPLEWATPVLFLRAGNARLLAADQPSTKRFTPTTADADRNRRLAVMKAFNVPPSQGLSQQQASQIFSRNGYNPRSFGSWVRRGWITRDGDRRYLTDKGRQWVADQETALSPPSSPGQQPRLDEPVSQGPLVIKPVPGRQLAPKDVRGTAILASRTHNNGVEDPAIRIFTGDVSGLQVGSTFDTIHRDDRKPCGIWTVHAIITDGRITPGTISPGTRSYRVNHIGD